MTNGLTRLAATLLRAWTVRPSTERRPGRHHRIALAADQRANTVQTTVSARPPGTERPVAELYVIELLQPVTELSTSHSSLRSADENALLVPRTSLKFGERALSVLLVTQLGTDFRQTSGQLPAPQLSRTCELPFNLLTSITLNATSVKSRFQHFNEWAFY